MSIDVNAGVGSRVRPLNMIHGFEKIGYQVDKAWGYALSRKQSIKAIEDQINRGIRYDFLYAESSTMPTLLTERHHLPLYPRLDFGFFNYCRHHAIPIGLFYRDVHWRFEQYRVKVGWYKRFISKLFYNLDFVLYRQYVDALFLPNKKMVEYVRFWPSQKPVYELPPGGNVRILKDLEPSDTLRLFYVGGVIPPLYDIANLLQGVYLATEQGLDVCLTVCCPYHQWQNRPRRYDRWRGERLSVVHASGPELEPLYQQHDIAMLYLIPPPYYDFAMPVKAFEAIGFGRPLITVNGTAIGDFVKKQGCGWTVGEDAMDLVGLLRNILSKPNVVSEKSSVAKKIRFKHTWKSRAQKVQAKLTMV
jgi:glycosyltransferase involved in cell wall biosynthesis